MADPAAIPLLRLVLEDDDLFAAEVIVNVGRDGRAFDNRHPDASGSVTTEQQHAIDRDLFASLGGEPLDRNAVADADAILLPAGLDDRVALWLGDGRIDGGRCLLIAHHMSLSNAP